MLLKTHMQLAIRQARMAQSRTLTNTCQMASLDVCMCCFHSKKGSQVAYLLDMFASILEEPELGGCGQANGECILSSWQLLNIKDGMIGLQED